MCLALLLGGVVHAQAPATLPLDLTTCPELQSGVLQPSWRFCAVNAPCEFIVRHRGSCARAASFLNALRPTSANLHPDDLWNAALPEASRKLYARPVWKSAANMVRDVTQGATGPVTTGGNEARFWLALGQFKNGRANGPAYFFTSHGDQHRGVYLNGRLDGLGEYLRGDGTQHAAGFLKNQHLNGPGVAFVASGRSMVGDFRNGVLTDGSIYRADATLLAEGRFGSTSLVLGLIYDESGTQVKGVVNSLSLAGQRQVAPEERNCREKMAEQDQVHSAQTTQVGAGTALQSAIVMIRLAQERKQLLATQCSQWSEHLRLLWDAEEALEEAQHFCAAWGGQADTDCQAP